MKRQYGDGSITVERGKHRVRIYIGNGKYKNVANGVDTEEEAQLLLNTARVARVELGSGMTLRKLGLLWLHAIRGFKSWKQVNSTWGSIVLDAPFVDVPLDLLGTLEIQDWADTLPQKLKKRSVLKAGVRRTIELDVPISHKSGSLALGYVKQALDWAVRKEQIAQNPATPVRMPKDRTTIEEPISYLPVVDLGRLFAYEKLTLEQRTVLSLELSQCPRAGEVAGMDWERVDWEARAWWVSQSWNTNTKNTKGRWQELLDFAFDALRVWWEHKGRPTRGIVFPSPQLDAFGKPKRYAKGHDWGWADNPSAEGTRPGVWRRAGVQTQIRFHDWRDTCATHLLSGTFGPPMPMKFVSKHIGHSTEAVTEARYAHVTREAMRQALAGVRISLQRPATVAATVAAEPAAEALAPILQLRETPQETAGSGGRDRTYDQSVNSRSLYR